MVIARPFLSNGMSSKLLVYTWLEPGSRWSSHTTTVRPGVLAVALRLALLVDEREVLGGGLPSTVKPPSGSSSRVSEISTP